MEEGRVGGCFLYYSFWWWGFGGWGALGEVSQLRWWMRISRQAFVVAPHRPGTGWVSWQTGLQEDEQRSGAESMGVFAEGLIQQLAPKGHFPDPGLPVAWGTLGSVFDEMTQSEHFERCMTVCDLAPQAAIIVVCFDLDGETCGLCCFFSCNCISDLF